MKLNLSPSFRLSLCAMALTAAGAAVAAQGQSLSAAPVQVAASHAAGEAAMPKHKTQPKASSGRYATPEQHEAAAVAGERQRGAGPHNPGAAQPNAFERNAMRRCEIFKTDMDRQACIERVRQPQISGSVEGGGVIREYRQTYQVTAPAPAPMPAPATAPSSAPAPAPDMTPAPQPAPRVPPTNHMLHPPVQPMTK